MQMRLELGARLGVGGFGEVYAASWRTSGGLVRPVAVKVLREDLSPDADAARRLRDEARVLAALDHPAIVRVHDLGEVHGRLALVMERVPGEDLNRLVPPGGLPARVALHIVGAVASALDAATRTGGPSLVHRDVKPSNIRVTPDGAVRLLDFGLARSKELAREAKTGSGLVVGTRGYTAPERLTRDDEDPAADVYSLGCVLISALRGAPPFDGLSRSGFLALALDEQAHDAHIDALLSSALRAEVRALATSMLAWHATGRPSALEVASTADDLVGRLTGPSLWAWCRRRDWRQDLPPASGPLTGWSGVLSGPSTGSLAAQGTRWVRRVHAQPPRPESGSDSLVAPATASDARPPATAAHGAATRGAPGSPTLVLLPAAALALGLGACASTLVGLAVWQGLRSAVAAESAPLDAEADMHTDPPTDTALSIDADTDTDTDVEPEPVGHADPVAVEPVPQPSPDPRPSTVRVRFLDADAWLVDAFGEPQPEHVEPGEYTIEARFDGHATTAGSLRVPAGPPIEITCNDLTWTCARSTP